MKPIVRDFEPQNVLAQPLEGTPYYRNSGIIYAPDTDDNWFAVGRVDFERFDDQNFQYVFSPKWSVIDALPLSIFQGIAGLDMSLRLERYYRANMTPYFIEVRTPPENRDDIWELLTEVGLDYYDRFEWLLRSHARCGVSSLFIERAVPSRRIVLEEGVTLPKDLQPDDCVILESLQKVASTGPELRKRLLQILGSGARVWDASEERWMSEEECCTLLKFLLLPV